MSKFTVILPAETWNKNTGWPCSVMSIPGARLLQLVVDGRGVPLDEVQFSGMYIRYIRQDSAQDAAATIEISKRLISFDTAIIVALIGLLGTLISATVSYVLGKSGGHGPTSPSPIATNPVNKCKQQEGSNCWGDGGDHTDYNGYPYSSMCCRNMDGEVVWEGRPRGFLKAGNNWFVCQSRWPGHDNPSVGDARNDWWLYTQGDTRYGNDPNLGWGWFPATRIVGAASGKPIPGLPSCDSLPYFRSAAP
ncbi:hypothetical protein JRI60_06465 [Archangium violaceum]|uniref:hypothetical protein n=1 Tax=Archangium violaceum TaxID=83451 RepID=UPI00194E3C7C|nr:hypothetical protein [Archangium violaceum]QRN98686.1 hypothetical protein JRI60_06465 [Archangium violaceum]